MPKVLRSFFIFSSIASSQASQFQYLTSSDITEKNPQITRAINVFNLERAYTAEALEDHLFLPGLGVKPHPSDLREYLRLKDRDPGGPYSSEELIIVHLDRLNELGFFSYGYKDDFNHDSTINANLSILHVAVEEVKQKLIEQLIKKKYVDPNIEDYKGRTPISRAVELALDHPYLTAERNAHPNKVNRMEIVDILLNLGANPNEGNRNAVDQAINMCSINLFEKLYNSSYGIDFNRANENSFTPINKIIYEIHLCNLQINKHGKEDGYPIASQNERLDNYYAMLDILLSKQEDCNKITRFSIGMAATIDMGLAKYLVAKKYPELNQENIQAFIVTAIVGYITYEFHKHNHNYAINIEIGYLEYIKNYDNYSKEEKISKLNSIIEETEKLKESLKGSAKEKLNDLEKLFNNMLIIVKAKTNEEYHLNGRNIRDCWEALKEKHPDFLQCFMLHDKVEEIDTLFYVAQSQPNPLENIVTVDAINQYRKIKIETAKRADLTPTQRQQLISDASRPEQEFLAISMPNFNLSRSVKTSIQDLSSAEIALDRVVRNFLYNKA